MEKCSRNAIKLRSFKSRLAPDLASLEKRDPKRIEWMCHVLEYEAMNAYMLAVNPKMRVTPLKQAPRKSPDEIACQWEFTMEG